jgi:hypothetical protein
MEADIYQLITTVLEFLVQACGTGHGYDVESSNGLRPLQTSQGKLLHPQRMIGLVSKADICISPTARQ